jgi:hypothetical protein
VDGEVREGGGRGRTCEIGQGGRWGKEGEGVKRGLIGNRRGEEVDGRLQTWGVVR